MRPKYKFIVLVDNKNIGNDTEAKTIANFLAIWISQDPRSIPTIIDTEQHNIPKAIENFNKEEDTTHVYVIGAGEHQLKHFQAFKQNIKAKTINLWLSHQPTIAMDECIKYIDWYALPRKSLNKTTFNSIGLAIEKFKDKTIPFYSAAMMTSEIAIILCPCFKIHTTAGYSSSLLNTYPVHITCPSYGSSTHLSIGVQATIKHSPGNTKYQPTPTHSQILQHEQLSNETTSIAK